MNDKDEIIKAIQLVLDNVNKLMKENPESSKDIKNIMIGRIQKFITENNLNYKP